MGHMAMHANEAASMWTRTPGQTWPGFAASLLWMWMIMMVPMMIPPFAVTFWRYRRAAPKDTVARVTWRHGARFALHCAVSCAPLMTIAVLAGSTKIHLIGVLFAAARAAVRPLSLTFDRSHRMFLSNVIERAACIRMPTSCKEPSTSSS